MDIFSHEWMVNDPVRVEHYRRAIRRVVRPGDVVAEIGAGSGILSCFACQAGAARVYAVESQGIGRLAEEVARANGFADRIEIIPKLSPEVKLPKKVDLIIGEILGSWALDENILGYTWDARRRWLKPGGRLLPDLLKLWFVPSAADHYRKRIRAWSRGRYGLDLRPLGKNLASTYQSAALDPKDFLAEPRVLSEIDLHEADARRHESRGEFIAARDGLLRGIGSWFEARLAPRQWLSTAPGAKPTCWTQVFFPFDPPLKVRRGDVIEISVGAFTTGRWAVDSAWEARVGRAGRSPREMRRSTTLSIGEWNPSLVPGVGDGLKKMVRKPSVGRKRRMSGEKSKMRRPVKGYPLKRANIVRKKVDEEFLLFDTERQEAHFINQTAEYIWDLCDGMRSEAEIARELSSKYNVSEKRGLDGVRILLSQLSEKGLLNYS